MEVLNIHFIKGELLYLALLPLRNQWWKYQSEPVYRLFKLLENEAKELVDVLDVAQLPIILENLSLPI